MPAESPCPICQRSVDSDRTRNRAWPFCSPRCKNVDLARWLGESYRIPAADETDESDGSVPPRGEG